MLKKANFFTAMIFIIAIPLIATASTENDFAEPSGSQEIPIFLTGFEPLPAGMEIIQREYPPRRDELIGERFEVGATWYDYQANGNLSKMIALDEDGNVHIIWMKGFNQDWAAGERHVFYNYVVDDEPQLGDDGEGVQVDDLVRGGFTNLGFAQDVGPIPIFHATQNNSVHSFIAQDFDEGAFESFLMPRINNTEHIWPHGTVDRNGRSHVLARLRNEAGSPVELQYVRGVPNDDDEWDFDDPMIVGLVKGLCYTAAASRASDKVALVFPAPAYGNNEWGRFNGTILAPSANNDLLIYESDDGEEFDWDNPINVTQMLRPDPDADEDSPFLQGDTLRPHNFVDACYDADDNLHVVFSTVVFFEAIDPNANPGYIADRYDERRNLLWHWDRDSDEISLIASGRYDTEGDIGLYWRANLSNPSIGADEDGNLYCVFTKFPAEGDAGGDRNGRRFVNSEIYATVSVDGGSSWAEAINLTDTHAPNNDVGEGASECWSSLAEVVDDNLHITYIYDLDPGGIPRAEGQPTNNPVMYHRVPVDEIPTEPTILGMDFHVGLPPDIAVDEERLEIAAVPDGDPVEMELTVSNTNDDEDANSLYINVSASDDIEDVVSFDPPQARIAPGEDRVITVIFAPEEEGQFEGTILIEHNVPDQDPVEVEFLGLGVDGYGSISGTVYDADDENNVIEGAIVTLTPGNYQAVSDEDGLYSFEDVPAFTYRLVCEAEDFLPYVDEELNLEPDEEVDLDIAMLFGTFELSEDGVELSLGPDDEFGVQMDIENRGNGAVSFTTELILFPDDDEFERWTLRETIPAEEITEDRHLQGVAFANDHFYISGGNNGQLEGDDANLIYVLDHNGDFVRSFNQFAESRYGMRDLTWDGDLLWGSDGRVIYGFTTGGDLIRSFDGQFNPNNGLAWDSDRNLMWQCSRRTNIVATDIEGNVILEVEQPEEGLSFYALAYYPDDPDGRPLYVFVREGENNKQVFKCDPDDGQLVLVADLPEPDGSASGLMITPEWDPHCWTAVGLLTTREDVIAVWQLDQRSDWIELDPTEGLLDPDEPMELNITFRTFNIPAETDMNAIIRFEHNGRGDAVELPVTVTVTNAGGRTRRTLDLRVGWNMVSLNIEPDEDDVPEMTRDLVDDGTLLLVKDDRGRFYAPLADEFNNIPNWNFAEGYLFKMARSDQLDVDGIGIEADREIALTEDWQMISYYPRDPITAPTALSGIQDQLIIAKDGLGHFYVPEQNFSNIGRMREGQGYMVKMSEDAVLVYQLEQEDRLALTSFAEPTHFVTPDVTDRNMSLLLLNVPNEITEIAAVDPDGRIVGVGTSDGFGRIGLAVWGCGLDECGLSEGESFALIGWDGTFETIPDIEWIRGRSDYTTDELAIGRIVDVNGVPDEYALYQAYPNPFNARTMIRYDLPEATSVRLELFDANGRLVATLIDGHQLAGRHSAVIDAGRMASGIYFYRLQTEAFVQIRKAVLLR